MALNEINLAIALLKVGQIKKYFLLSFHNIRNRLGQKTISRYSPFKVLNSMPISDPTHEDLSVPVEVSLS
jgi:hypothetical protein